MAFLTYGDIIKQASSLYIGANSPSGIPDLEAALQKLENDVLKGSPNETFRQQAESLLWRIKVKIPAIRYFCGGYLEQDYAALNDALDEADAALAQTVYQRSKNICFTLRIAAVNVHAVMEDAAELICQVFDENDQPTTASVELLESTGAAFKEKAERLRAFGDTSALFDADPTGACKPLDPCGLALADLQDVCDKIDQALRDLRGRETESFFRDFVTPLEDEPGDTRFDYYQPLDGREVVTAPTVVLCSPLWDEIVLFVRSYANERGCSFVTVRAQGFAGKSPEFLRTVFEVLAKQGSSCVLCGLAEYRDPNRQALLEQILHYAKAGHMMFPVDNKGDRALYDECYAIAKEAEGLSGMDVSYKYLLMPSFQEVTSELDEKDIISGEEYEFVRKNMAYMGYVGLNRIVKLFAQQRKWRDEVIEISDRHEAEAAAYISHLPTLDQFMDSAWGVQGQARSQERPKRDFDYDSVRAANPRNVEIILNANISLFAKCGMITRYCMLCGDDVSVWPDLPVEEKSKRLTDASRLVAHLLNTQYAPEVQVVAEEDWTDKKAGGFCCDGGKMIKYREKCCKDYTWTVKAVCHECYHSFQHTLEDCGWFDWHWQELGVTKNRVNEWKYNSANYRSISKGFVVYMIQVMESDARTFEEDCFQQSDAVYNLINLE